MIASVSPSRQNLLKLGQQVPGCLAGERPSADHGSPGIGRFIPSDQPDQRSRPFDVDAPHQGGRHRHRVAQRTRSVSDHLGKPLELSERHSFLPTWNSRVPSGRKYGWNVTVGKTSPKLQFCSGSNAGSYEPSSAWRAITSSVRTGPPQWVWTGPRPARNSPRPSRRPTAISSARLPCSTSVKPHDPHFPIRGRLPRASGQRHRPSSLGRRHGAPNNWRAGFGCARLFLFPVLASGVEGHAAESTWRTNVPQLFKSTYTSGGAEPCTSGLYEDGRRPQSSSAGIKPGLARNLSAVRARRFSAPQPRVARPQTGGSFAVQKPRAGCRHPFPSMRHE